MSWYNYPPLATAGPEHYSPLASAGSGASSQFLRSSFMSYSLQKTRGTGITTHSQCLVYPQICFASYDDASGILDMPAYCDSRLSDVNAFTPDFSEEVVGTYFSENHVTSTFSVIEDEDLVTPYSSFISPSFKYRVWPQASTLSPILPSFLEDSPESPPAFTPRLEYSCTDSSSSSLALSPYSPLPLPPIFMHESGSKISPIPIDTISSSASWLDREAPKEASSREKCEPIGPPPNSSADETSHDAVGPFARGSTVAGTLWPPISLTPVSAPAQADHFKPREVCEEIKCVPLGVAKRQAAEFRSKGAAVQLSSMFLMGFLGQPPGQTKWRCYIQGCGKQLTRKGHMMDHVRMHLDERSFACDKCSQMFLRKADCKRHAATHNPTKGFRCDSCPKSYARKDLLTRHRRMCWSRSEMDSDGPAGNIDLQKKRKGIHADGTFNEQSTHDMSAVMSPSQGCHKGDQGSQIWRYREDNKENIDPMLFPSGPMFSHLEWQADVRGGNEDSENRRKKARTRL